MLTLGNGAKKHLPASQYLGAEFSAKVDDEGWVETTLYYAEGAVAVLTNPEEVEKHAVSGDWLRLVGEFCPTESGG